MASHESLLTRNSFGFSQIVAVLCQPELLQVLVLAVLGSAVL